MNELKYVRLDMIIWAPEVYASYEELLFSSLKAVKPKVGMDVRVSWQESDILTRYGSTETWPFTLHRGRYRATGYGGRSEVTITEPE